MKDLMRKKERISFLASTSFCELSRGNQHHVGVIAGRESTKRRQEKMKGFLEAKLDQLYERLGILEELRAEEGMSQMARGGQIESLPYSQEISEVKNKIEECERLLERYSPVEPEEPILKEGSTVPYLCIDCGQCVGKDKKCPDCGSENVIYEPDYELYSEWGKEGRGI